MNPPPNQTGLRTLIVWCCLWLTGLHLLSSAQAQPRYSASPLRNVFGDYSAEIRTTDGHVDEDALLARLTNLGVNTYCWLIWHATTDWDDLSLFLPKAAPTGLRVWVYLVPPSESPPNAANYSEPFRLDYGRWGEEIARLSLTYTNVAAWVMDDFYVNRGVFTPDYVRSMQARAKAVNPKLAFLPLMYFPELSPSFMVSYGSLIDGVVAAYPPDTNAIAQARAVLNGTYTTNSLSLAANTASQEGDFVMVSQPVAVLSTNGCSVSFREYDEYSGPTKGYHFRQFLVDGNVVWEADVADHTNTIQTITLNLSPQVQGKTNVVIAFRLFDKQAVYNFPITWSLVGLQATGLKLQADLSQPQQWVVSYKGSFKTGFGGGNPLQRGPLPMILMEAGNQEAFQARHGNPVTDDRFRQYLSVCLKAWQSGLCDGIITYCLDKGPESPFYTRARKMFQAYQGNFRSLWQR